MAREHVIRFGDTGFYDPNRQRYVDLTPSRTIVQIRAGAAFKRKFGAETIEAANALDSLADYLERKGRPH